MKKLLFIIACLFYLLLPATYYSQQHNFTSFGVEEGLPQSQVICTDQDSLGRIWIGTYGGGLSVFDGSGFFNFSAQDGLPDNIIWSVAVDHDDHIWVGTGKGLALLKDNAIITFDKDTGVPVDNIWALEVDQKGTVWIGTDYNGIYTYSNGNFKKIENEIASSSSIYSLNKDHMGNVYASYVEGGISIFESDGSRFITTSNNERITANSIENTKLGILLGTQYGLYKVINGKIEKDPRFETINNLDITQIFEDRKGRIWFGTFGDGVYYYEEGHLKHFNENNGLSSNYINTIMEDREGNIWLGTDGSGLCLFQHEAFLHYTKKEGLPTNLVMCILRDYKDNYWFGTENGLHKMSDSTSQTWNREDGLLYDYIVNLYEDYSDRIWIATQWGINLMENGNISTIEHPLTEETSTHCFYEPEPGKYWIGTEDGLVELFYSNQVDSAHYIFDHFLDCEIFDIQQSPDGAVWISSANGLFTYQKSRLLNINSEYESMSYMAIDHLNNIWVTCQNGILHYNSKTTEVEIFNTKNQLSSDFYYSIAYMDGSIWAGTHNGFVQIVLDGAGNFERSRLYRKSDGFTGIECNDGAILVDNHKIWFGTLKGATLFNPEKLPEKELVPDILIDKIMLFSQDIDSLKQVYLLNGRSFSFDYYQNHLTFYYTGIALSAAKDIVFRYKLVGFDEEWQPATKSRHVSYSNIKPGNYSFVIQASIDGKNWSESAEISIYIAKPIWEETWFIILSVILVISILVLIVQQRTKRINRQRKELEIIVEERTQEIVLKNKELEMLSIVATKMNEALLITDKHGNELYFNDAFLRNSGYATRDAFYTKYGQRIKLQDISTNSEIENIIQNFEFDTRTVIYDSYHVKKDGEVMWTTASLRPIYKKDGKLDKIAAVYTDITNRKQLEESLKKNNKDITDSIRYAKQIQRALLPSHEKLKSYYPESFIYSQAKDIVSGDFFWAHKIRGTVVIVAADCTGHGVPGAFMSLIGNQFLNEITSSIEIDSPDKALNFLDNRINVALKQDGAIGSSKDGMDMAMIAIDSGNLKAQFSGANNPLYLVRNKELIIIKPTNESIGGYRDEKKKFNLEDINLQIDDCLYVFSDGYIDQFGGPKNKKFMRSRFKKLLLEVNHLPMDKQRERIRERFLDWKGENKQLDDVLVIGIRIK